MMPLRVQEISTSDFGWAWYAPGPHSMREFLANLYNSPSDYLTDTSVTLADLFDKWWVLLPSEGNPRTMTGDTFRTYFTIV